MTFMSVERRKRRLLPRRVEVVVALLGGAAKLWQA